MARPLRFQFEGTVLPLQLEKVDRTKLYGWTEIEAVDEQGRRCELATLASDGQTLVGDGGRAIAFLSPEGEWRDKKELAPIDLDGQPIAPVPSSFEAPVPLATRCTIDDYLSHNVKLVYRLAVDDDGDAEAQESFQALVAALRAGALFTFPYSFRGGLVADVGFLLANPEGDVFMAVGQPTTLHFVGLAETVDPEQLDREAVDGDDDDLDFGMM